jgi:hypothetical protein
MGGPVVIGMHFTTAYQDLYWIFRSVATTPLYMDGMAGKWRQARMKPRGLWSLWGPAGRVWMLFNALTE